MKRLLTVIAVVLALNFLASAGFVGWLVKSGKLDHARIEAIKEIVFPKPAQVAPTTQPVAPTTQPVLRLEALMAQYAGRPPVEQLDYIRQAFEAQTAQLEQKQMQIIALATEAENAKAAVESARAALEQAKKDFTDKQQAAGRLASEKGFKDSLDLYMALPAKQVKALFMGMEVETAVQYLQAMETADPSAAKRLGKEFKTSAETERLKLILNRMSGPVARASGPTNP